MSNIVRMQFGSHVYGTNVASSDTDFKAVALPEPRDIVMQRSFKAIKLSTGNDVTKNSAVDIDEDIFSLHYFMKLLVEGQTVCLDMLFTPKNFYTMEAAPLWAELQKNKERLLTKKMSSFAGYCQAQAAKYSLKGSNLNAYEKSMNFFAQFQSRRKVETVDLKPLFDELAGQSIKALNGKESPLLQIVEIPNNKNVMELYLQVGPKTKIPLKADCKLAHDILKHQYDRYGARAKLAQNNEGVDWKALMHAVRVCDEAIELCGTGNITFPRQNKELLLKIRKGELPYTQVAEMIEDGLVELGQVKANSMLPETPDIEWIENFVYDTYKQRIIETK